MPHSSSAGLISNIFFKILLVFISLIFLGVSVFSYLVFSDIGVSEKMPFTFLYEKGETCYQLVDKLKTAGIIRHPRTFLYLVKLTHNSRKLRSGEYEIVKGMSLISFLHNLLQGKVVQHNFQIIEGETFAQILTKLNSLPDVTHTIVNKKNYEIMEAIGASGQEPEGRFFPETYYFERNVSDIDLLKRAYDLMQQKLQILNNEFGKNLATLPYDCLYKVLIVASLIEKETSIDKERPIVAGVIVNRLRNNMRLQIDASVIYGLNENYEDTKITKKDLKKNTAYNLYLFKGLPHSPICMPSYSSLKAAFNPQKHEYLFYVSKGDGSNEHVFSTDLESHKKALAQYLENIQKYGK